MSDAVDELAPYNEEALVRFGTSSFSSKDWVGPFYPPGMAAGAFLSHYATVFDTVEVDSTYYAVPATRLVEGWRAKVPEGFLLSAKFPRSIVHAGRGPKPDARYILQPDSTYEERDRFLEVMTRMGDKLGTLLIQFPYFNRATFPSAGPFLERLDPFLRDLPREGFRYAVEIRNKAWLKQEYVDILRRHEVDMVLVDQAWMPHGDEIAKQHDVQTGRECYIRLLGDRKGIEKITTSWDKEVVDHGASMYRWASLIVDMMKRGIRTLVYVNNHYAGHAPSTVKRLKEMVQHELDL